MPRNAAGSRTEPVKITGAKVRTQWRRTEEKREGARCQKNARRTKTEDTEEGSDPSKKKKKLQVRGGERDEPTSRGAELEVKSVEDVDIIAAEATTASTEPGLATGGKQKNADKNGDTKGSETKNQVQKPDKNFRFFSPDLKNTEATEAKIMAALNIRACKGKDQAAMELIEKADVVGTCETWWRPEDATKRHIFQECVAAQLAHNKPRGYGGMAVAIHPAMRYQFIGTQAGKTGRYIMIRIAETYVTTVYLSPVATVETEQQMLSSIAQHSRGR